jgi:hypothetical protein
MSDHKNVAKRPAPDGAGSNSPDGASSNPPDNNGRRSKFGAAADGWEAYNSWLDRVRQQATPTSRQAVIAKSLYSVSSYKSWADKAKDAFDKDG